MASADLLDPRASDRYLRAYALLASEYAAGAKSAVDSLLPFVRRAVSAHGGQGYDPKRLSAYVQDTYRVKVPIYMMDAFKNRLLEEGAVARAPNAPDTYLCVAKQTQPSDVSTASWTQEELADFEATLANFAREIDYRAPYASADWNEALIKFFAGADDKKPATVNGKLIFDAKRIDDRIISGFVASLDKASARYGVAKKLYYGVLVADFFTCINELSAGETLGDVAVVLDTTLLMRLLGTSGVLLRDATLELISDIQNLGGRTYYYAHSYEEMIENLEALRDRLDNRADINRETSHAIATGETSLNTIRLLIHEADARLGALNITQHPIVSSPAIQTSHN